jgi:hypothetical protein
MRTSYCDAHDLCSILILDIQSRAGNITSSSELNSKLDTPLFLCSNMISSYLDAFSSRTINMILSICNFIRYYSSK